VAFNGFAWPFDTFPCPLSNKPLLYFDLAIQELRRRGKRSEWVEIFRQTTDKPFAIIDDTGFSTVFPNGATLDLLVQTKKLSGINSEFAGNLQSFLKLNGSDINVVSRGLFGSNKRIVLKRIHPGTPLYVHGHFVTLQSSGALQLKGGVEGFMSKMKSFAKGTTFEALRFDANKDGKISGEEWYETGASVALKVFEGPYTKPVSASYATPSGVVAHSPNQPSYIADAQQRQVIARAGRFQIVKAIVGALLVTAGIVLAVSKWFPH
jgi:hypothetical protein